MGGHDPYSSSKGCAELVASAYRRSFLAAGGIALASARAGNVIGGGDWALDRLVPDILRALGDGQAVEIRNPHAIRPWQHVLEPLAGYLILAQRLYQDGQQVAEGFNFGPQERDARSVEWIVEQLVAGWGAGASWRQAGGSHPHEAHYLKLDIAKAGARLGWQPRWNLAQALTRVLDWQRAWLAGADMGAYCHAQIADYSRHLHTQPHTHLHT
jgi:CDP-glucose 4,6-dehydratase